MNCKVKLTVCQGAALLPKVTATQDEDAVTITVKDMNGEASATDRKSTRLNSSHT